MKHLLYTILGGGLVAFALLSMICMFKRAAWADRETARQVGGEQE